MHNTEGEWVKHDITAITNEEWAELKGTVDIIAGGFPCQAFSIAGKRGGFEDTRGTLFFDIARAAKEIQPSYLFLENVKGLFSHDKGRTFGTIIQALDELGYFVEWGLFNSKFWGVPQNRERVFIVATRKDVYEKPILFDLLKQQELNGVNVKLRDVLETEVDEKFYLSKEQTDRLVFNMSNKEKPDDQVKLLAHRKSYHRNTQVFDKDGLTETLDTGQGGGRGHYTMEEPKVKQIGQYDREGRKNDSRYRTYDKEGLSPTLTAAMGEGGNRQPFVPEPIKVIGSTQKNATITDGSHSPTLTSAMGSGGGHVPMMIFDEPKVVEPTIINPLKGKTDNGWHFEQAVYDDEGLTRALKAGGGSGNIPKVVEKQTVSYNRKDGIGNEIEVGHTLMARDYKGFGNQDMSAVVEYGLPIKEATKQGYALATDGDSVNLQYPDSKTRRGRVGNQIANTLQAGETNQGVVEVAIGASRGRNPENPSDRTTGAPTEQRLEINQDGTSNTLTSVQKDNYVVSRPPFRIRKLTPLECFRLQGFPDNLFYKAQEVNSNSQLYKQAGNSVTVNVIEAIAKELRI